jgi:hypothetical protein
MPGAGDKVTLDGLFSAMTLQQSVSLDPESLSFPQLPEEPRDIELLKFPEGQDGNVIAWRTLRTTQQIAPEHLPAILATMSGQRTINPSLLFGSMGDRVTNKCKRPQKRDLQVEFIINLALREVLGDKAAYIKTIPQSSYGEAIVFDFIREQLGYQKPDDAGLDTGKNPQEDENRLVNAIYLASLSRPDQHEDISSFIMSLVQKIKQLNADGFAFSNNISRFIACLISQMSVYDTGSPDGFRLYTHHSAVLKHLLGKSYITSGSDALQANQQRLYDTCVAAFHHIGATFKPDSATPDIKSLCTHLSGLSHDIQFTPTAEYPTGLHLKYAHIFIKQFKQNAPEPSSDTRRPASSMSVGTEGSYKSAEEGAPSLLDTFLALDPITITLPGEKDREDGSKTNAFLTQLEQAETAFAGVVPKIADTLDKEKIALLTPFVEMSLFDVFQTVLTFISSEHPEALPHFLVLLRNSDEFLFSEPLKAIDSSPEHSDGTEAVQTRFIYDYATEYDRLLPDQIISTAQTEGNLQTQLNETSPQMTQALLCATQQFVSEDATPEQKTHLFSGVVLGNGQPVVNPLSRLDGTTSDPAFALLKRLLGFFFLLDPTKSIKDFSALVEAVTAPSPPQWSAIEEEDDDDASALQPRSQGESSAANQRKQRLLQALQKLNRQTSTLPDYAASGVFQQRQAALAARQNATVAGGPSQLQPTSAQADVAASGIFASIYANMQPTEKALAAEVSATLTTLCEQIEAEEYDNATSSSSDSRGISNADVIRGLTDTNPQRRTPLPVIDCGAREKPDVWEQLETMKNCNNSMLTQCRAILFNLQAQENRPHEVRSSSEDSFGSWGR